MENATPLPAGSIARALTVGDIDAVVAMINACELHDSGEPMWERADLLADASIDGFDRGRDWIGVFDGDVPVAWGMIVHRRSAWVDVHPGARGRGVGTWLREWAAARAREMGSDRVGQTIDDTRVGVAGMFRDAGYTQRHTSWILRMDHPERPSEPSPPQGVTLRPWRPEDTDEALTMFEEAFAEWPDRLPSSPATWRAMTIEREGFEPDDLLLAEEHGLIVGGAYLLDADPEVWVDKLAVRRDTRHRGIGRALMQVAFARSFARGYDHTSVSTDSKTGALTLYERLGMRVTRSFTHWAIDL